MKLTQKIADSILEFVDDGGIIKFRGLTVKVYTIDNIPLVGDYDDDEEAFRSYIGNILPVGNLRFFETKEVDFLNKIKGA